MAMGSPLGPTLANIFLGFHEQIWLDSCPIDYKPVYYARYVDDIFVLFRHAEHLNEFKLYLNKQHANMHFTSEVEDNNVLPFLDINIIRDGNEFVTSVYRKKTFSGVYTNFESFFRMSTNLISFQLSCIERSGYHLVGILFIRIFSS